MKKLSGILTVTVVVLLLAGCRSNTIEKIPQPGPKQTVFKSSDEAVTAMLDAVKKNDTDALSSIFGEKGRDLVFSSDSVEDKELRTQFSLDAAEKMSISTVDNREFIVVGEKEWKFPVPIVSNGSAWFFDTAEGRDDLLNHRTRMNELRTIANCRSFVKAQQEYSYMDRIDDSTSPYALNTSIDKEKMKCVSWESKDLNTPNPLKLMLTAAAADQADKSMTVPYNGYLFKVLLAQGEAAPTGKDDTTEGGSLTKGFALLAYPIKYGESGILTFVVSHLGIIYEKNLGDKTLEIAPKLNEYTVDDTWTPVSEN